MVLAVGGSPVAEAQTFSVIHTFTGQPDGSFPSAGLTLGRDGNLYGTAAAGGGAANAGTVYRLKPSGSAWIIEVLYSFKDIPDGAAPSGRVTFGPNGALYGVTARGGVSYTCTFQSQTYGCGTAFKLVPPVQICRSISCPWTESVLYRFGSDGAYPLGDLTFDEAGNIYGTTSEGGAGQCLDFLHSNEGCGTVYKLGLSGDGWTSNVLYAFQGSSDNYVDGVFPQSGVIFDAAGNLYGTAARGGLAGYDGYGVVYKLAPASGAWNQSVLYSFTGGSDGSIPAGGLVFDGAGNLYGTTVHNNGVGGGGTAYELTNSAGAWGFSSLYDFPGNGGSVVSLTMDSAGNLYGTTNQDGAYGFGSVFKLSHSSNGWTYTSLHDFTGGSDGAFPDSNVILDRQGKLYGTASAGGDCNNGPGCGTVWMITP